MKDSWIIAAVAFAAIASPAGAQNGPAANATGATTFPASLDREVLSAWLRSATDLDPSRVVSVRPSDIIGVVSARPIGATGARQFHVVIRSEVINAQTVREAGHASWSADADIDCDGRRGRVNRIVDYTLRNLKGVPREAAISARWLVPPPGTHLDAVVRSICDITYQRPLMAPPAQVAAAPPPRARLMPDAAAPAPSAAPAPAAAPPPPRTPAAPPPAPAPAPVAAAAPVAEPPPAPAPAPRPRTTIRTAAQISASDSEAQARQALAAARRTAGARMDGLATKIEPATVNGRTYYRALVFGFGSSSEAADLCRALTAAGKGCFLRPGAVR